MTEDEMVGYHHRLNGQEFEQALGVGDGQENLMCWNPWGPEGQTEWLNWTKLIVIACKQAIRKESIRNFVNTIEEMITFTWS